MSQKLSELNTGSQSLDDDLRELFAICDDTKKLNTIKQAIADTDISSEKFSQVVPELLTRLSILLSAPQFIIVLDRINKEAVGLVEEAKSLIEKHFANLFENEHAKSYLKQRTKEEEESEPSLADEVIRGFSYYFIWEGNSPELTPAVRIAFKNQKKEILLQTGLDWEDFSLHLNNLAKLFVILLEKGKPLAELEQVDLSDSQKVLKNIEQTLDNLQKIKEIMPIYKAKTETDSNNESVKDSSN